MKAKMLESKTLEQEKAAIRNAERGATEHGGSWKAEDLIREAVETHGLENVAVSWSGGRCSTATVHMALQIYPEILIFHCNTGVRYPVVTKYIKKIRREWDFNYVEARPEKTFWDCVEEYGFPHIRKAYSEGKPRCCYWLKERPLRRWAKERGIEGFITGMRVAEARVRMFHTHQHGQFYFSKTDGFWKYNPIAFWTTEDVMDYHEENGIPRNPLYEKRDRTGCWPCTAYVGWRRQLLRTNPKLYNFLMEKMGEPKQELLDHFYKTRIEPCRGRG